MIISHWKRLFFTFIAPTFYEGGGSSPPTQTYTQSTVSQSSVPDWLRPQTEAMLGTATQQIFNVDANNNITGIKGYQPYSTNPAEYVAAFSPLQKQSFTGAQNLETPAQIGAGSDMAYQAGQYGQNAINPAVSHAYMSPYMQNVVETQKQGALRDFDVQQQMRNANAAKAGAFGGSRQAIENAEAQRNLGTQLGQIQATGLQNAFEQAQQSQQFAAQQQLGAAGALGDLGAKQISSQMEASKLQNQLGQQQTQQQQDIINNAISNYAMQQQYPLQQLGLYNALLRGYAIPTTAQTTYQAPPSGVSQYGGLAATALGAYGAAGGFGKKKGGVIKAKSGGLADLALHNTMKGA